MSHRGRGLSPGALREFGAQVEFGSTASDYASYRAGFPARFFEDLTARNFARPGQNALDLGTGTGTVARGLARLGLKVTGIDPALPLLEQARALCHSDGLDITFQQGTAEQTGLQGATFDLVTAGQCWHWFDRAAAAQEALRLLSPGGRLIIAHFDWLPLPGNVVEATENLILKHNPGWVGAHGCGIYPDWMTDMAQAGFKRLETASFDVDQPYSHLSWRGRIRASAGVAASLPEPQVTVFDEELTHLLNSDFPEDPLSIPHRVWFATGIK